MADPCKTHTLSDRESASMTTPKNRPHTDDHHDSSDNAQPESQAFTIAVTDVELADLRTRLEQIRWPDVLDEDATSGGLSVSQARRLVDRWLNGYDYRIEEERLNRLNHRTPVLAGRTVHFLHHPATSPTSEHSNGSTSLPIVLLHGWPDGFTRFERIVPLLTAAGHDVIVPSLPGFLFSEQPAPGHASAKSVADVVHDLVSGLGYHRYAVHGGDWGGTVAEQLAIAHPEAVAALHLTDVPFAHHFMLDRSEVSETEKAFLEHGDAWAESASYWNVQSNDPTTLCFGLADSPLALATWLLDKYTAWTDREPDLDAVITLTALYWHTHSIAGSLRLYSDGLGSWDEPDQSPAGAGTEQAWPTPDSDTDWSNEGPTAPTAFAVFPADISVPPREYAERFFAVERFTLMPRGGHFGAQEEPQLLADDLIAFLQHRA